MITLFICFISFVFAQKSITITKPLKGDKLIGGTKSVIEWTSTGILANEPIGVEVWDARTWLSVGGFSIDREDSQQLHDKTKNTGRFEFFVPVVDKDDSSFYAVVYMLSDRRINGKSEQFSVEASEYSLVATEPFKATNFKVGEPVTIRWSSNVPKDASLRILFKKQKSLLERSFSTENDVVITMVDEKAPNTGEYTWSIPLSVKPGDGYHFEVVWELNGLRSATPHNKLLPGPKNVAVVQPLDHTIWFLTGTQKTVEWQQNGFAIDERFKIELFEFDNGVPKAKGVLAESAAGPRLYIDLPADTVAGLHKIRVSSTTSPSLFADSESFFVQQGGGIGTYMGAKQNLVDWDASSTVESQRVTMMLLLICLLNLFV